MNWLEIITLGISLVTMVMVGVEIFINTKQRKIDRHIEFLIDERRRMQRELFVNVLGILSVERELQYNKFLKDRDILFHEILNCKISVWINLNRENVFYNELRSNCNGLVTWVASALEEDGENTKSYLKSCNKHRVEIWKLIDKYIEEENRLNDLIATGKVCS